MEQLPEPVEVVEQVL
jgi:ElaB/YqjD/DUF883 family membrane-anchored ribosome-binding protein